MLKKLLVISGMLLLTSCAVNNYTDTSTCLTYPIGAWESSIPSIDVTVKNTTKGDVELSKADFALLLQNLNYSKSQYKTLRSSIESFNALSGAR